LSIDQGSIFAVLADVSNVLADSPTFSGKLYMLFSSESCVVETGTQKTQVKVNLKATILHTHVCDDSANSWCK
jgi:hypothetical protein